MSEPIATQAEAPTLKKNDQNLIWIDLEMTGLKTQTDRKIAEELQRTYDVQREAQMKRQQLERETAIANMQAITDRFGPSYKAYLVVPLVGAFFVDLVNATILQIFTQLPFLR